MTTQRPRQAETVRTAELVAALSLATDLGMGFPFEYGLQSTLVAMRLAEVLDVDRDTASDTFYGCLLMYSGCTIDGDIRSRIFGSSMTEHSTPVQFGSMRESVSGVIRALPPPGVGGPRRVLEVARRMPQAMRFRGPHFAALCEVAEMIAERFALPESVNHLFFFLTERWDGKGVLGRAAGEEIPMALRIIHVARDATLQRLVGGDSHAVATVSERAGHAFDPHVARAFAAESEEIFLAADTPESVWEGTLAAEPKPWLQLDGEMVDRALGAMASFADMVSPWLTGHSGGVAELALAAASHFGLDENEADSLWRAAMLHDIGRVAVHPSIWLKAGILSADEREQVRLHGYHTERVLSRSRFLSPLSAVAGSHHERADGSGYHRGVPTASLPPSARLLAAADAFYAMTEPRAHRAALTVPAAAKALSEEAGRHDPHALAAVLEAAGQPPPELELPAGLTEREAQVVGLLARGLQTKQMASALGISIKTADRHIQNAYRKIGVSSRAAATLFASEHGLVQWGELPIQGGPERP